MKSKWDFLAAIKEQRRLTGMSQKTVIDDLWKIMCDVYGISRSRKSCQQEKFLEKVAEYIVTKHTTNKSLGSEREGTEDHA